MTTTQKKTVLVTGASGFLASYVIQAFLSSGWKVRGTVRSLNEKASHLKERYPDGSAFELVEVKDIVTGEGLDEAMKGVDAVAHTASPYALTVTDPMKDFIAPAVDGTLSVLKAAKAAGIKRVVVTSSFAAVTDFAKGGPFRDYTYTEKDWNPTTLEQALEKGRPGAFVYSASKTLAEHAALDYGISSGLEVVTLNPPMIYGPPLQSITSKDEVNTSANAIYALVNGEEGRPVPGNRLPLFCAVEDVAEAHVRAIEKEGAKGKRFILCGGAFTWEDAVEYLTVARPAIASRLPKLPSPPEPKQKIATLDTTAAKEILGMEKFKEWKDVLTRTLDSLLEKEKEWYCEKGTCQKDDWKAHKAYCKAWTKFYPTSFSVASLVEGGRKDELESHILPMALQYETMYINSLPVDKREETATNAPDWMVQKPHCESCWKFEEKDSHLDVCPGCLVVAWCSSKCKEHSTHFSSQGGKKSQCQTLQQAIEAEKFIFKFRDENPGHPYIPWCPSRVLRSPPATLPTSWDSYYATIREDGPYRIPAIRTGMISENMSMPLTILAGLERLLSGGLGAANKKKLRIQILGAASAEFFAMMTFEEILHQLPGVQQLDLEFIGPLCGTESSALDMDTCPDCERKGRKRFVSHVMKTYHDYFKSLPGDSPSRRPDLVVAFNSGSHDASLKDSWAPTIKLLSEKGFPCIFSSLSVTEAKYDKERFEELGVKLKFSEEKNVWGGEWARWDAWDSGDGFYRMSDYICGWGGDA